MKWRPPKFTEFSTLSDRYDFGQRVLNTVLYDEIDPVDLPPEWRPRAIELFSYVDRIPPACHRFKTLAKGRGIGGTREAAEFGVYLAATAPIVGVDKHELIYAFIGGPKLKHAGPGLRFALECARHHGIPLEDVTKDGFTLVRHDGYRVRFEAFAASRGGDNLRGVPILFLLMTEAAFYLDETTGSANGETIFAAAVPRLLPHGRIVIESTVWAESGLLHREFSANFGHPTTGVAAFAPTRLVRDSPGTLAMIELEHQRDPVVARRELEVEWLATAGDLFFDGFAVNQAQDHTRPVVLPPLKGDGWVIAAGYDPAYRSDSAAGYIVRARPSEGIFEVVESFEARPAKGKPLVPSVVDKAFATVAAKHGAQTFVTDQHYQEAVREHVQGFPFRFATAPSGNAGKMAVFGAARERIHAGQVKWSAGHRTLTEQLKEVKAKPLPGGLISIESPRKRGQHGDHVSALCLAIWQAEKPLTSNAYSQARAQRPRWRAPNLTGVSTSRRSGVDSWWLPPKD